MLSDRSENYWMQISIEKIVEVHVLYRYTNHIIDSVHETYVNMNSIYWQFYLSNLTWIYVAYLLAVKILNCTKAPQAWKSEVWSLTVRYKYKYIGRYNIPVCGCLCMCVCVCVKNYGWFCFWIETPRASPFFPFYVGSFEFSTFKIGGVPTILTEKILCWKFRLMAGCNIVNDLIRTSLTKRAARWCGAIFIPISIQVINK